MTWNFIFVNIIKTLHGSSAPLWKMSDLSVFYTTDLKKDSVTPAGLKQYALVIINEHLETVPNAYER